MTVTTYDYDGKNKIHAPSLRHATLHDFFGMLILQSKLVKSFAK